MDDNFRAILTINAEMATIAADIARDARQEPRTRVAAAVAASKIVTSAAPVLKTINDIETHQIEWAERVLARSASPTFNGGDPVAALKLRRAQEVVESLSAPDPEPMPDW